MFLSTMFYIAVVGMVVFILDVQIIAAIWRVMLYTKKSLQKGNLSVVVF